MHKRGHSSPENRSKDIAVATNNINRHFHSDDVFGSHSDVTRCVTAHAGGWGGALSFRLIATKLCGIRIDCGLHSLRRRGTDWPLPSATRHPRSNSETTDDHGNNSATATGVSVPSATLGDIEVRGDTDWFQFVAVAGVNYVFETALTSLHDSKLTLYASDGMSAG